MRAYRTLSAAIAILLLVGVTTAGATTLGTFSDPSPGGQTPLFFQTGSQFTGGWHTPGLTLVMPYSGQTYANATFSMAPVAVANPGVYPSPLGSGDISFQAAGGGEILHIHFGSATLDIVNFGATQFLAHDSVTITGVGIPGSLQNQAFAFGLANPAGTPPNLNWTAAFTCSALVPEPGSLLGLILGLASVLRRR
jgi:hypothetical protein